MKPSTRVKRSAGNDRSGQTGVALIVALIMLLMITLIGLAAARSQTMEMRMTTNAQNRELAMQSAEAGLRFAEGNFASGVYSDFSGTTAGLYEFNALNGTPPAYLCIPNWLSYEGATYCAGTSYLPIAAAAGPPALPIAGLPLTGPTAAKAPSVVLEQLPPVAKPGNSIGLDQSNKQPPQVVIRITSQGYGADNTSSVRLQSIYQ